jgi:D-arabinose 1-dehydrogenase-like Zn-dependent alcohol dehydrogenase
VDYVDTDPARLAIAARLGATTHERPLPDRAWERYPLTVNTSANPKALVAAVGATWPDGVCTDTGIYYQDKVELPLLRWYTQGIRFVTSRVNARAAIPQALKLLAGADLGAVVQSTVDWEDAPEAWTRMRAKTVITR